MSNVLSKLISEAGGRVTSQNFFIARVVSIVLGSWDPQYKRDTDIGRISYQLMYSPLGKRRTKSLTNSGNKLAYPMWGFVKNYPLVNEIVMIMTGPSPDLNDDYSNQRLYYFSPYNLWNDSNHNAFPDLTDYENQVKQSSKSPEYAYNSENSSSLYLGYTFREKTVRNLQPFEGDSLIQARFGQSIRFGSTVTALKNTNTWSQFGQNGSPITIITNEQGGVSGNKFNYTVEDINRDGSSIYMTSDQEIKISKLDQFPLRSFGISIDPEVQTIVEKAIPFPIDNYSVSAKAQDEFANSEQAAPIIAASFDNEQTVTASGEGISSNQNVARQIALSMARSEALKKLGSQESTGSYVIKEDKLFQTSDGKYRSVVTIEFTVRTTSSNQINES